MSDEKYLSPKDVIEQLQEILKKHPDAKIMIENTVGCSEFDAFLGNVSKVYYAPEVMFYDNGCGCETYWEKEEFEACHPEDKDYTDWHDYIIISGE